MKDKNDTYKGASSMSVIEMAKLLGLSRGEAYWLVKKRVFRTTTATGHIRILIDSFEEWYDSQLHYKKVNGDIPGSKWITTTMSVLECAALLGTCDDTIYGLIRKNLFKTYQVDHATRIDINDFYRWYKTQAHYKTTTDAKYAAASRKHLLSLPDVHRLLNTHRNNVYALVDRGYFDVVICDGKRYITKESFEKWYRSKRKYRVD